MSFLIPGVPETISREKYNEMIQSLGLDPKDLISLRWESRGIEATVIARDEDDQPYAEGPGKGIAAHKVWIEVPR